jgi:hypothetical protein
MQYGGAVTNWISANPKSSVCDVTAVSIATELMQLPFFDLVDV